MILTRHELKAHPSAPPRRVTAVSAVITSDGRGHLTFDYRVRCPMGALVIPAPSPPARKDDLWRRTCFEAFIRPAGGDHYCEFNLSPSGEWAAYAFTSHRTGMANLDGVSPPLIETKLERDGLSLTARVALPEAVAGAIRAGGDVGLTAVIEEEGAHFSYWALAHPADKPDFHNGDCFVHRLSRSSAP